MHLLSKQVEMGRHCKFINCEKKACFNFENETTGSYCLSHKHETMIDVVHKKCEYEGCKIQPKYNFEGEKKRRFCLAHKHNNMVSIGFKTC
jgi:hypothetical protein